MKQIYVATKARGFLLDLFNCKFNHIEFFYEPYKIYETNSKIKILISKLVKAKIADHFGIIQRIKVKKKNFNIVFSYNRFLKSTKEYVIYLENPLALVHYSTDRNNTLISRYKLRKHFSDPNLKSIICLSKACYETVNRFYTIPERIKVEQLYPLVQVNKRTNKDSIKMKTRKSEITCLYISSDFKLKGGRDILEVFNKFQELGINNIKLKIVTLIDMIDKDIKKEIEENENINLYDFKFSKEELNELYNDTCIFLNPTRQDSFSLVVLEAMKSGNAILSTDLYAIPEMVLEGYNGYLTYPKYRFFDYDNMPNKKVWNNRKNTIYSDYIDENIVDFLFEKILYLNTNRDELEKLAMNSFEKSNTGEFSEDFIKQKWNQIFEEI